MWLARATALGEERSLALFIAAAPAFAMLLAAPFAASGAEGLFQVDLAGLVVCAGVSALAVRRRPLLLMTPVAAALLCALVHLVLGSLLSGSASLAGALAAGWLVLATAVAASGLSAVGRGLRAPWLTAGALGAGILWVAMTGLYWADPLSERLPRERRYECKQAVLQLDLATACAYDGAGFDRFHEPTVYRDLPIASSIVAAPSAGPTGAIWLLVGLLAWGVAWLLGVDRRTAVA